MLHILRIFCLKYTSETRYLLTDQSTVRLVELLSQLKIVSEDFSIFSQNFSQNVLSALISNGAVKEVTTKTFYLQDVDVKMKITIQ